MAYKPATVVIEESQGLELAKLLSDSGRSVIVYDPLANDEARKSLGTKVRYAHSAVESIQSADAVIIANPDPDFAQLRAEDFPHRNRRTVVLDIWRLMREQLGECEWIRYLPFGVNYKNSELTASLETRNTFKKHSTVPSVNILGVPVSAIDMGQAVEAIDRWIATGEKQYVCVANTHSINECKRDASFKEIHRRAGMVTPDGMPLVWVSHLKGFRQVGRVDGFGLMHSVCAFGLKRGYRHFLYGGWPPVVVEALAQRLAEKFLGIQIVGTHCPPFRQEAQTEDPEVIAKINAARPDIVWIGLGAPKEERWVAKHIQLLSASILIGVGAAFDYHAGTKKKAPMWMQQRGLEWLYRLSSEPRRLGSRYLRNNPAFVKNIIAEVFAKRTA
jgi:N-acetylglucosaminyldiphosphoundecaprenol N-acetyl-beta-D-mannosaminyltransferase